MKLTPKLTLGYVLIACLVILVGFTGIKTTDNSQKRFQEVIGGNLPLVQAIQDVRFYGLGITAATAEFCFLRAENREAGFYEDSQDEHAIHKLRQNVIAPFDRALERYENLAHTFFAGEKEISQKIRFAAEELKRLSAEVIDLKKRGVIGADVLVAMEELTGTEYFFRQTIDAAMAHEYEELEEKEQALASSIAKGHQAVKEISLAAFFAAVSLGLLIARGLSKPIIQLKDAAVALGKGNLETRIAIKSQGEIGVLAKAFNEMAEALNSSTVSMAYMENVLGSMTDALFVLDPEGRIKKINRACSEMFGYREEELLGRGMERIFSEPSAFAQLTAELEKQGSLRCFQTFFQNTAGFQKPVSISGGQLINTEGQIDGWVFVAQDITDRREAQQALQQKNHQLEQTIKELDQFAYVVSHDLKAPLRAIANLAQWIEEDSGESLEGESLLNLHLMQGRVGRMEGLINGILEYSRIGRVKVAKESIDTAKLLQDIVDAMPVPDGFTIEIGPGMPTLQAARLRLDQLFSNLIGNAIRFNPRKDGRVAVSVRETGEFYEFSVADNGPGIAPEYHQKIFTIFQTLNARDKVESIGVGLTLVKKIVEEQGGAIVLESEEGQGATFRFSWPKQPVERQAA